MMPLPLPLTGLLMFDIFKSWDLLSIENIILFNAWFDLIMCMLYIIIIMK